MNTENILVLFSTQSPDLKALYHGIALVERIKARLFVLLIHNCDAIGLRKPPSLENACMDIVRQARQEKMPVFFYSGEGGVQSELMKIIKKEHIDLILIDADDQNMEDAVKKIKADMPVKVIKVKEKSAL
ncbi:hypothetical protein [Desulfobacter curvatus]|uniref:hypothetical protein n=1 Tax=Desulfobacter curvatus TaxID=2290 RepID=UPI0003693899|nr:hypothetical protein [Desulfobacter curvatus]